MKGVVVAKQTAAGVILPVAAGAGSGAMHAARRRAAFVAAEVWERAGGSSAGGGGDGGGEEWGQRMCCCRGFIGTVTVRRVRTGIRFWRIECRVIQGQFDVVWFPPASDSADAEEYMPTRWSVFDSSYGSAADLKGRFRRLKPVRRLLADVVINHQLRAGDGGDGLRFAGVCRSGRGGDEG